MTTPRRLSAQLALPGQQTAGDALRTKSISNISETLLQEAQTPKPQVTPPTTAPAVKKMNLHQLRLKYEQDLPISMVTAYDYSSARIADAAGVDVVLVGDSVSMVVLGHEDTTEVTMEEMLHHCRASARGTSRALLVGDLPFGSYLTPYEAVHNGVRLVKEGRVDAVKLEGGERVIPQVRELIGAGVAVMGHIGLTPQSHAALGGYRVQGRTSAEAMQLMRDCLALQEAGCFAIVMEMVPGSVAQLITDHLSIPTIGIGSGLGTNGQVQVYHDLLGLYDKKTPKFVRQFGQLAAPMQAAISSYVEAVQQRTFPQRAHTFPIAADELSRFSTALGEMRPPVTEPFKSPTDGGVSSGGVSNGGVVAYNTSADNMDADSTSADGVCDDSMSLYGGSLHRPAVLIAMPPSSPVVVSSILEWRQLQSNGSLPGQVGLVPTMGALHAGHLSLVQLSKRQSDCTAVSLFVNPRQFAAHEDLGTYPRTFESDLKQLASCGADYVFAPTAADMYPPERSASLMPYVDLAGADDLGEGRSRPGFFRGVGTVLTKLLNIIQPSSLYMGQKDGMQCLVTSRLITDLDYNVRLVVGPTIREDDGLAMSSRNVYLSPSERSRAPLVYRALQSVESAYHKGERSPELLRQVARDCLAQDSSAAGRDSSEMAFEYLSFVDTHSCLELGILPTPAHVAPSSGPPPTLGDAQPLEGVLLDDSVLVSISAKLGTTRLIDNLILR